LLIKEANVRATRKELERGIRDRVRQLGEAGISISGSLGITRRRCGRPSCRCASDEQYKHPSLLLNSKVDGKTKSIYVPVGMTEEVEHWVEQRRHIKGLLREIDQLAEQIIRCHVPASRAAAASRRRRMSISQTCSRSS
jgi:hypothetical protein